MADNRGKIYKGAYMSIAADGQKISANFQISYIQSMYISNVELFCANPIAEHKNPLKHFYLWE